jgi:hypothetical protein
MRKRINWSQLGVLLTVGVLFVYTLHAEEARITALNPLGQPPPLKLLQMAPRLDTIDGKTIYVVDVQYPETQPFFDEMVKMLSATYPKTKWILKKKIGSYFEDDPDLWKEIRAKGNGMVIAIGH